MLVYLSGTKIHEQNGVFQTNISLLFSIILFCSAALSINTNCSV